MKLPHTGSLDSNLALISVKQIQNFAWVYITIVTIVICLSTESCSSLHYNGDNSYLFVNGKEIFKFKADIENVNFQTQFGLGTISNGSGATESKEVSPKAISDILNIYKYLMVKNNLK